MRIACAGINPVPFRVFRECVCGKSDVLYSLPKWIGLTTDKYGPNILQSPARPRKARQSTGILLGHFPWSRKAGMWVVVALPSIFSNAVHLWTKNNPGWPSTAKWTEQHKVAGDKIARSMGIAERGAGIMGEGGVPPPPTPAVLARPTAGRVCTSRVKLFFLGSVPHPTCLRTGFGSRAGLLGDGS